MGAAVVKGLVDKVVKDNKLEKDETAIQQTKERINQLSEVIELKLGKFYDGIVIESGKHPSPSNVPICSVVRKEQSLYAHARERISNKLTTTIKKTINNILDSKWNDTVTDLVHGTLQTFFGSPEVTSTGKLTETKFYHVVWSNNCMLRLDVFVTACSISHMAGWDKTKQMFGGYIMVVSVVDMTKINWQVFLYEFSKFYDKVKEKKGENVCKSLLESIDETRRLMAATGKLFEEAKEVKPYTDGDRLLQTTRDQLQQRSTSQRGAKE